MSGIALDGLVTGDDIDESVSDRKLLAKFKQEIKFYETKTQSWEKKTKKIVRRYKDERSPRENDNARFNILWSNTQLLLPALYAKKPVANIERRNRIQDDLGRIVSTILERCVSYFVNDKFDDATRWAVLDLLLCGRGVLWVRYEPKFETAQQEPEQITDDAESEEYEMLSDENVCWDYVHMEDFGHSWGRVWDEVDMVWRKVPMDKEELEERFPDIDVDKIPMNYSELDSKDVKVDQVNKKAVIYELWNKTSNKVYWLHTEYKEGFLDQQDDPLGLRDFFPCPKPLFATLANDSCIPTPDYVLYQDQAIELDTITGRLAAIVKAVKVAGVYDASAQGVQRLLSEGVENQLIPVDQWAMLSEKGGLAGVMTLMPMKDILETLSGLYEAREKVKQDIYEITGISDILRGSSDPNETYGAQRIKSQFGTLRLSARQDEVQRFCRELIYIGAQIIAKHFSIETIKKISNQTLFTAQEKQILQANQAYSQHMQQMQHPPQPGAPPQPQMQMPPPPPVPPEIQRLEPDDIEEIMSEPTWDEVMQFMHSDEIINYRIDIETDSTIKQDQDAETQARVQFLQSASGFMKEAMQVEQPELAPLVAKMLMFGVRGFKIGRDLESEFELTIKKLEKQAQNPQKKPNPEMIKIQGQMQLEDKKLAQDKELKMMQLQIDERKAQADSQAEITRLQAQAQVDTNQAEQDAKLEQFKAQINQEFEKWKAQLEAETKIAVANIQAKAQLQNAMISKSTNESGSITVDENGNTIKQPSMSELMATVIGQLQSALQQNSDAVMQSHQILAQAMTKPKQVVRDQNGNIVGVQ